MPSKKIKNLIYNERYHDNCHDYLKPMYIEKYAAVKYKQLLYEIRQSIPKISICNDTKIENYADIIVCDQHAVVFGHHRDIYPILATYALNACIGLVFYLPKYGVGSIAHIDGLPGYSMQSAIDDGVTINFDPISQNIGFILRTLRNLCKTNDKINVDYYLIGGIFELSEVMINDILNCINQINGEKYVFTLRGRNILGPENQSRNICLDTRNGEITYFDYVLNAEFYGSLVDNKGVPKNIIRAPRISEALLDVTYVPSFIRE